MLPFGESFAAIVAALLVPSFVGLMILAVIAKKVKARYLAAFSLGVYLWFWSDTIGDASYLYVNEGYAGGIVHASLVILTGAGILLLFWSDRTVFLPEDMGQKLGFAIPVLVAFAIGFHGMGEGAAFSETAATTTGTNLFAVFGGFYAAVGFVLHKAMEPMIAGAAYWVYAKDHAKSTGQLIEDMLVLTLVFSIPGIIGGATDYYFNYNTTYLFAFGLGTSLYGGIRVAKPLFLGKDVTGHESLKTASIILLGIVLIYLAALFHSTG